MDSIQASSAMMNALAISKATQPLQASKTILLVEDEEFVREMICHILKAAHFHVFPCANAKQAQAVFRQYGHMVDVLITDVVLPGENGRELARDLLEMDSELKVILISGYPEELSVEQGRTQAQMFYLPKPFSSESLLRKVWQVTSATVGEIAI